MRIFRFIPYHMRTTHVNGERQIRWDTGQQLQVPIPYSWIRIPVKERENIVKCKNWTIRLNEMTFGTDILVRVSFSMYFKWKEEANNLNETSKQCSLYPSQKRRPILSVVYSMYRQMSDKNRMLMFRWEQRLTERRRSSSVF